MTNLLKAADAMAEAQKGILASLVAAVSLLRRSPKKAAPSDKMFDIMINDYERAIKAGREALSAYEAAKREAAKSNEAWKNEVNKFLGIGAHSHD